MILPEAVHAAETPLAVAVACAATLNVPPVAMTHPYAASTPVGTGVVAVQRPPSTARTASDIIAPTEVKSASAVPSAYPAAVQVTVNRTVPGDARSALNRRSPAAPPLGAVTVPDGDDMHLAAAGSTVNVSATVTVPVPEAVVSSRPVICTGVTQSTAILATLVVWAVPAPIVAVSVAVPSAVHASAVRLVRRYAVWSSSGCERPRSAVPVAATPAVVVHARLTVSLLVAAVPVTV